MAGIYGETGQKTQLQFGPAKWLTGVAVSVGDFTFRDTDGFDKPLSSYTYVGNVSAANTITAQQALKAAFRGVSMARRTTGQANGTDLSDGAIIEAGEFQFAIDSATANTPLGNYVTFANTAGAFSNSNVVVTSNLSLAIGKIHGAYTTGAGFITVNIFPQLATGAGMQAIV